MPKTPPKTVQAAQDPLADLRDPEDAQGTLPGATDEAEQAPGWLPLATQEAQDDARSLAIAALHADTTAVGFLHRGGCACRYITGVVMNAVLPVQGNDTREG